MKSVPVLFLLAALLLQATPGAQTGKVVLLEKLDLGLMDQAWGRPRAGRSVEGNPLKMAGRTFTHGVGTHAYSEITIDLAGGGSRFTALVGVDDESRGRGSVFFRVLVDEKEAWRSGLLKGGAEPVAVSVDLRGAKLLTLIVEEGPDGNYHDHVDWCEARIHLVPGAEKLPRALPAPPENPPVIAMTRSPRPRINHPRITGATPGRPFLFRIPASGAPPLRFAVEGLPPGLRLDPATGILTGTLRAAGRVGCTVTVTNPRGRDRQLLTIVGGRHKLGLTPPMGWNSWNVWAHAVDDAKVRRAAEWMVRSGLAAHGYTYVNIDDTWEGKRDDKGVLRPNEKFPDMKALADHVHSLGLKLGIYSSPGPKTCANYEGSYGHELIDARTWAAWGVDYLKHDWCSYRKIAKNHQDLEELVKPYMVMRKALDRCGRDIFYSLCQYGMGEVWTWGGWTGGNCWRTTGDITDSWSSMSGIGFGQAGRERFAGPGRWNDPDMLVVGMVGWGPNLHPTRLTKNEQVTHITLWSLLAAPLLLGCDLSRLDAFTLALLTNDEVIAVNQDPRGRQAERILQEGRTEVWARPLDDGSLAVGLFNRDWREQTAEAPWAALGIRGPHRVRDLWLRADLDPEEQKLAVTVPRHGARLFRLIPSGE